jgi:hypothetical protein
LEPLALASLNQDVSLNSAFPSEDDVASLQEMARETLNCFVRDVLQLLGANPSEADVPNVDDWRATFHVVTGV